MFDKRSNTYKDSGMFGIRRSPLLQACALFCQFSSLLLQADGKSDISCLIFGSRYAALLD